MRRTRNPLRVFWLRLQLFISIFFILFVIVFSYWFVFVSPFFQIKAISIEGYHSSFSLWVDLYLQQNNTRFAPFWVYAFFPKNLGNNKSMFSFYYSDLEKSILKNNSKLESIETDLNWKTGHLVLKIKQREIDFLWCLQKSSVFSGNEEECYYLDKNGIIFEKALETSGSFFDKIVILETKKRFLGTQVINPEHLLKLEQAFTLSAQEDIPFSIDYLEIKDESFSEIRIITQEGFYISYNINNDFKQMLRVISELKKETLKDNFIRLEYIDCKYYPSKVYYRLKQ